MSLETPTPLPTHRPIGERLLMASLLLGFSDLAGKILAFIITVLRTRNLSEADFGAFGYIIQTIGMFAQIAGFSLGLAATRYVALYRQTEPDKARQVAQFITLFGIATNLVAAGLMFLLTPQLAFHSAALVEPIRWSTLVLVMQSLSGLFLGLLSGLERFRAAALAMFLQNVVMLVLTAWWAPFWGLVGTLLAMAIGFAVTLSMAVYYTRDLVLGRWAGVNELWQHRRILWEFCLPALLGGILVVPAYWLATKIIVDNHGPIDPAAIGMLLLFPAGAAGLVAFGHSLGLRQVALYTAADQFRPLLGLLANVVAQPMMPIVTSQIRHAESHDASPEEQLKAKHRATRAIERSFQLAACLILPAHALFAFAAPYVMAIFGRSFAADWNVFLIVLTWGAFAGMISLIGVVLFSMGKVWLQNLFLVIYSLILVAVTWLLQSWGEYALATANLCATLSTFILGSIILLQKGYFTKRSILVLILAMVWMAALSVISALVPNHLRIVSIPVALAATLTVLFLCLKSEVFYVIELVRRKIKAR